MSRLERKRRRRAAAEKLAFLREDARAPVHEQECASTDLHEERLEAVVDILRESGAASVLDLGCGPGALLRRLVAEKQFTRIVGVDVSLEALRQAARLLAASGASDCGRVSLMHGSFASPDPTLAGFDAAVMVETLEHIQLRRLSQVERAVFAELRPGLVLITTPNREYNVLYGLAEKELRHADHHFEWSRMKFQTWSAGVARRNGYRVDFEDLGPAHPALGSPTQMGVFCLRRTRSCLSQSMA